MRNILLNKIFIRAYVYIKNSKFLIYIKFIKLTKQDIKYRIIQFQFPLFECRHWCRSILSLDPSSSVHDICSHLQSIFAVELLKYRTLSNWLEIKIIIYIYVCIYFCTLFVYIYTNNEQQQSFYYYYYHHNFLKNIKSIIIIVHKYNKTKYCNPNKVFFNETYLVWLKLFYTGGNNKNLFKKFNKQY